MSGVAKATLIGRLGKDPELRQTREGKSWATFGVATSKRFKDGTEKTDWHNVSVWSETSANYVATYVQKGTLVYVQGDIENRTYDKNGTTMSATDIVVGPFGGSVSVLADGKGWDKARARVQQGREEYARQSGGTARPKSTPTAELLDDEIPF